MKFPAPFDHRPMWLRLLFLALLAPALAWGLAFTACAPLPATPTDGTGSGVMLTRDHSGSAITVKQGDIILVELERAGSTGYEWHLDEGYGDFFHLLSRDERERSTEKPRLGGPVVTRWQLRAEAPGETGLELNLYRQWEGKEMSADRFAISVTIE